MKKPTKTKKAAKKETAKAPAKPAKKVARKTAGAARKTRETARKRPAKPAAKLGDLGALPTSYGEPRLFAVAQEPHIVFCYWDESLAGSEKRPVFLRLIAAGESKPESEVEAPAGASNWYLRAARAGAEYAVELGRYARSRWSVLACAEGVITPREDLAPEGAPVFAGPAHAEFRRSVEKLRAEMREGESLAQAIARLEGSARGGTSLSREELLALRALLSTSTSSLTSGDLARSLSSPGVFSQGFARSSWGSSPTSGLLAAFGLAAGSSWGGETSWGAASSWGGAAWSEALSSWGASSSWPTSGSAGPGSSWSAQPFAPQVPRDFFMHVNAEVIFYGGTHPDAKLTVAGQEVPLRPDGTFRFHFVFPDSEYEIPVVATSPDGKETRRAALRFERSTAREGDVGATAQPPLGEPMGGKR